MAKWLVNEHLELMRGDSTQDERSAYVAGYNDAWYSYPRWSSNMPDFHPAWYNRGFLAARQDKHGDSNVRVFK